MTNIQPTQEQTAEAVERMKKRSCVSERGATGLLWTVFEAEPFCSRRIASFATEADAREFVYFIPAALTAAQEERDKCMGEIAELKRDKEIVEWVERERPNMLCLCEFGEGESVTGYHWEINDQHEAKTFRSAIDSAQNKK